jgi:hypothetical protein
MHFLSMTDHPLYVMTQQDGHTLPPHEDQPKAQFAFSVSSVQIFEAKKKCA